MADIKISALTSVEEVQSTDVVPVVSGSATMKASASQIKDYVNGDLDYTDSATAGSYVTAVSESNGVVNVTKEAADTTPTASSKKMVTSGGVYAKFDELSSQISNKVNWSDYAQLGAVNLFEHTLTTKTTNGITFTVNDDKSITCTGTASDETWISIGANFVTEFDVTASGCPSDGSSSTYFMSFSSDTSYRDYGEGVEIPSGTTINTIYIVFKSGYAITDSLTFYPMIAPASYSGSYVPYAKTNKELTSDITDLFVVASHNFTVEMTANVGQELSYDFARDGYTLLGIRQIQANHGSRTIFNSFWIEGSELHVFATESQTESTQFYFEVFLVKTGVL